MKHIGFSILDGDTSSYVKMLDDKSNSCQLTSDANERTIFYDKNDAQNIMEMLNEKEPGSFFILDEYEKDEHVHWNVEEGTLSKPSIFSGNEPIFHLESEVTREAKIEFLDKMKNGMMSYILNLAEQYQKDAPSLPKDSYGEVKTVSLKAWLKRNDSAMAFDRNYHYGETYFMGCERYISNMEHIGVYDHYEDYVDECFHRLCKELQRKEQKWFVTHDEAHILETKVREMTDRFGPLVPTVYSSSDGLMLGDAESDSKRKMTIPEMKELLDKYTELEAKYQELSASVSFDYAHPKEETQKKVKEVEYGD